jgi:single-strand DNA-binding protein
MSFNKITIVGYLGRDPELRYTPQGVPVCSFSVATSERRRDSAGESQENTTWFRVTAWRRQAEIANQYLKKGSHVYIEGRLTAREYTGRDGSLRTSLDVQASDIQFLDRRGSEVAGAGGGFEEVPGHQAPGPEEVGPDDVPF